MRLFRVLRSLFTTRRAEAELDAELQFHLDQQIEENLARGMAAEEARHAALRAIGAITQIKEQCRETRTLRWMENLWSDLRYAIRGLRKAPGFAVAVILSLALGIGANTAIFGAVDAVMLRKLPVEKPDELVQMQHWLPKYAPGWGWQTFLYSEFKLFRDQNHVFVDAAAASRRIANARIGSDPEAAKGAYVSPNFYAMLGVRPFIGRVFGSGNASQAVLHYSFWQRVFGGDPSVIGHTLIVEGDPYTVIGVAAPGFDGIDAGEPLDFTVAVRASGDAILNQPRFELPPYFWIVARLKPGISLSQAAANLNVIYAPILLEQAKREAAQHIRSPQDWITVRTAASGAARIRDQYSRVLIVLLAITGAVLLIACVNVANLLLARATARRREFAVRLCLGASRGRVVAQMMTEAFVLCLAGAIAGIALARWCSVGLAALMAGGQQPVEIDPRLDGRVLLFAIAISVLTGAIVGILPALRINRVHPGEAIREAPADRTGFLRAGFLVFQVASSLVLVAGAGLFVATLHNLETADIGLRRDHVVLAKIEPGKAGYDAARRSEFYRAFLDRLRESPGVRSASISLMTPITGAQQATVIQSDSVRKGPNSLVAANLVSSGYFATMGTPVLAGHDFSPHDRDPKVKTVVINESLARDFFSGANPVGRFVTFGIHRAEVIAVVKDAKFAGLRVAAPPTLYVNWMQSDPQNNRAFVEIYAHDDAHAVAALRRAVAALNPNVPLSGITTFDRQIESSLVSERLMAAISALFGALALSMSAIGLYGVLAYAVTRRTREIGIRMAVGAEGPRVIATIIRGAAAMVVIGLILGTVAALALGRFVARMLYDVKPADPWILVIAAALLSGTALLAAYVPARRASRVDPMIALRYE